MSSFSQRRGPNVSQYISNLNSASSNHELPSNRNEAFALDENIKMFTNAEVFDFEQNALDGNPIEYGATSEERLRRGSMNSVNDGHDLIPHPMFEAADNYPYPETFIPNDSHYMPPIQTPHPMYPHGGDPFNMRHAFDPTIAYTTSPTVAYPITTNPKIAEPTPRNAAGTKRRKAMSPEALIEGTPEHAEEDKRRRNTAASARFRVKKKLKEQALEDTVKDATKRADAAEKKVLDLQKEVKFLRNLLLEARSQDINASLDSIKDRKESSDSSETNDTASASSS